jgi:hypothetical protein
MRRSIVMVAAVALASCGGTYPTVGETIDRVAPAYCAMMKTCSPSAYMSAFPDDATCIAQVKSAVETPDDESGCTEEQVTACVDGLAKVDCNADLTKVKLPSACTEC